MTPAKLRAGPYWQAYCPLCGTELGTYKPKAMGERAVCRRCGTEAMVVLSILNYPICYAAVEVPI